MELKIAPGLFEYQCGEVILVFVRVEYGQENRYQCTQKEHGSAETDYEITNDFTHKRRAALSLGLEMK